MKNLKPEHLIGIIFTLIVVAIITAVTTYNIIVDTAAIKAGLHQGVLPGSQGVHWVK